MSEPTNQDRGEWAKTALEAFARCVMHRPHIWEAMYPEEQQDMVGDLLANLMHLRGEYDFDNALATARMHYAAEVEE